MEVFQELGARVEKRWRSVNYSERAFPELAAEVLEQAGVNNRVDPWEIIRWLHTTRSLPQQKDPEGKFGNPPVTLFSGARFHIDVYYWLDGTTAIHQHAFSGAFQVLLGSSIHSRYCFREDQAISEHLAIGEITLERVELLRERDIRKIQPGRDFIHSLFHLDRPSATVTIRTEHTPSAGVQFEYRKPHLAVDPFYRNAELLKKVQSVSLLLGMKHPQADSMVTDLICSSDFQMAYYVLAETFQHLKANQIETLFDLSRGKERFAKILERARAGHGPLIDVVLRVLEEQDRQAIIIRRRGTVTNEEHRFFLALLLNVSGKESILELVQQRFPEREPIETVLDWIEDLARTITLGSPSTNALGIEDFNDDYVFVLEALLKESPAHAQGSSSDSNEKAQKVVANLRSSILGNCLLEKC